MAKFVWKTILDHFNVIFVKFFFFNFRFYKIL